MNEAETTEQEPFEAKWLDLEYRVKPRVLPRYDWLRCQVGRVQVEQRDPKFKAESVFELLGYGRTMPEAEEMAEKKLGRDGH